MVVVNYGEKSISCPADTLDKIGILKILMAEFPADPFVYECNSDIEFNLIYSIVLNQPINVTPKNAREMFIAAEQLDYNPMTDLYTELEKSHNDATSFLKQITELYGGYNKLIPACLYHVDNVIKGKLGDEKFLNFLTNDLNFHHRQHFVEMIYNRMVSMKKVDCVKYVDMYLHIIWGKKLGKLDEIIPKNGYDWDASTECIRHKIAMCVTRFLLVNYPNATEMMLAIVDYELDIQDESSNPFSFYEVKVTNYTNKKKQII